jgi:hypothetical protein
LTDGDLPRGAWSHAFEAETKSPDTFVGDHPMFDERVGFVVDRCGEITYGDFTKAGPASVKAVSENRCALAGIGRVRGG